MDTYRKVRIIKYNARHTQVVTPVAGREAGKHAQNDISSNSRKLVVLQFKPRQRTCHLSSPRGACVPTAMSPGSSPSGTSTPKAGPGARMVRGPQSEGPSAQGATSMQVTGLASSRWIHRST